MRVVRREQSSSIAIELTFAPPQINKMLYQSLYLEQARGPVLRLCIVLLQVTVHVLAPNIVIDVTFY